VLVDCGKGKRGLHVLTLSLDIGVAVIFCKLSRARYLHLFHM
jgi:hypothetical protein